MKDQGKQFFTAMLFVFLFISAIALSAVRIDEGASETFAGLGEKMLPVLIIDAGHGGIDGGASSQSGLLEKDINLSVALRTEAAAQLLGFRTVMTRRTDISVEDSGCNTVRSIKASDIRNRLRLSEETENGILISIHQNYFGQSRYYGGQVFYGEKNPESRRLAEAIQHRFISDLQPESKRVAHPSGSGIYILKNSTRPAVMAECGFLSNPKEAAMLADPEYQKTLSLLIMGGLLDYLTEAELSGSQ